MDQGTQRVLTWPPKSPRLNLIEHLRDVLEKHLRSPYGFTFRGLVESVPRRLHANLQMSNVPAVMLSDILRILISERFFFFYLCFAAAHFLKTCMNSETHSALNCFLHSVQKVYSTIKISQY